VERFDWFHRFSIFFGCFSFAFDEWMSLVADLSFLDGSPTVDFRGLTVFPGEPIDFVTWTTFSLDGPPFELGGPSVQGVVPFVTLRGGNFPREARVRRA
jgi:hypothetical protein